VQQTRAGVESADRLNSSNRLMVVFRYECNSGAGDICELSRQIARLLLELPSGSFYNHFNIHEAIINDFLKRLTEIEL
jgi:hypothetical protein